MKKKIISILVILVCTIFMVSAVGATSNLNLGVQVAEVPATFTIHYDPEYNGGAVAPDDETVSVSENGHRPYVIYYSGNRAAAGKVTVDISATSFLNQADASLPSAPVTLYTVNSIKGVATSTASAPASIELSPIDLPAGNVPTSVVLDKSDFMVAWSAAPGLPAGSYRSTITVGYMVM